MNGKSLAILLAASLYRSPFPIKPEEHSTVHLAPVACELGGCLWSAAGCEKRAIPHMVAELWLRTPLH